MHLRNTSQHYGIITKILHALIAICFITQIVLGYVMGYITNKPLRYQLYGIHKSIGFSLLIIAILFVLWRLCNTLPSKPKHLQTWEIKLSKCVQFLLYCGVLIMPMSGWLMSSFGGYKVSFWGWFYVTAPVAVNKGLSGFFDDVHVFTAYCVAGLIGLHILCVLKHALIYKHNILLRMF
jgi:cytochrome b561